MPDINPAFGSSKLRFIPLFTCIAVGLLLAAVVQAEQLELSYQFEHPKVTSITIEGEQFDQVDLAGAPNTGAPGKPALPGKGVRILVPSGTEVTGVEVVFDAPVVLGEGYKVVPCDRPLPLSTAARDLPPLYIDEAVYQTAAPIPAERFQNHGIQRFRGYEILVLTLNPVIYTPATGRLAYYPNMSVSVTVQPSRATLPGHRGLAVDRETVARWVDNPLQLDSYGSANAATSASAVYDMLLITTETLRSAFQPLKDYHDTTGVLTEIRTLTEIGTSDPHLLRDYIRSEFQTNGIEYVLIGGDDNLIPALDVWVKTWEGPDAITESHMPGDFYFSCLDGTFDFDGDGLHAEPGDGEGGGEIDLLPDVHLGRISAGSITEVNNMVTKTIAYMEAEDPYLDEILIAGEQLGFGGLGEYGGYAMDEMVDHSDAHGFMTYNFPSDVYQIDKLYDLTSMPSNYWPASEMIARINSGYHCIAHLGHSGPGYAMRTDTAMLRAQLTNTEYCFIYSEGCSAGQFDLTDCWAEYVTVKLPHGAFGCIANSRLGIGSRTTAHPVHLFDREFWDAIYNADESKRQLGRAISDCRADLAHYINTGAIRWNFYEINLFGDPAVPIKSVRSVAIRFPDGAPAVVSPDTAVTFEMHVQGIGEGTPLAGSGEVHYQIDGGALETASLVETSTNVYEVSLPSVACGSSIEFYCSAAESTTGRVYHPTAEEACEALSVTHEVTVFEDDFEEDQGWTYNGLWQIGVPLGLGGDELQYPVPDPTSGSNGVNVLGYNLSGDYENSLPERYATSPSIDCSEMYNTRLRFSRWLGVEQPVYDHASVEVSDDGSTWTQVWANPAVIVDLEWTEVEYDISAIADNETAVFVRFVMGSTDGGLRYCGWNVDDLKIVSLQCESEAHCCVPPSMGDIDQSGGVDITDISVLIDNQFISLAPLGCIEECDIDLSGEVDITDLSLLIDNQFLSLSPLPECP